MLENVLCFTYHLARSLGRADHACTKGIRYPRSIPSINTLDRYPWPTLSRHSINISVDTRWTLDQHLSQHSVDWSTNFRSMQRCRLTLSRLSTDCWLGVDRVSTEYRLGCWPSIDWDIDLVPIAQDVDGGYRSKVDRRSIGTWSGPARA